MFYNAIFLLMLFHDFSTRTYSDLILICPRKNPALPRSFVPINGASVFLAKSDGNLG